MGMGEIRDKGGREGGRERAEGCRRDADSAAKAGRLARVVVQVSKSYLEMIDREGGGKRYIDGCVPPSY